MEAAAERACRTIGYENAGTFEFLLGADGTFHFIELNARLQVEHPVSELVTGIDIVREQLRIAAGEPLPVTGRAPRRGTRDRDPAQRGGSGATASRPLPGTITRFRPPLGPGVRVDTHLEEGSTISPVLRLAGREADRVGGGPPCGDRARRCGRSASSSSAASRRRASWRSTSCGRDEFVSGDYSTSFLDETGSRLPALAAVEAS